MKPTKYLFLCIVLVATHLHAQTGQHGPVIILSTTGNVVYRPSGGGKSIKVKAGAVLKDDGAIALKKNSSVTLMRDGKFARFDQARPLTSYSDSINRQGLGFEYDFVKYVEASVALAAFADKQGMPWIKSLTSQKIGGDGWSDGLSDLNASSSGWANIASDPKDGSKGWGNAVSDPKDGSKGWGLAVSDPKDGSKGWGTSSKKSGSAWGGKDAKITAILPFGYLLAQNTTFFWSNPSGAKLFTVSIKDEAGKTLYTQEARDTFCLISLENLHLSPDNRYQWSVSPSGADNKASTPLEFQVASTERQQIALKKVRNAAFFNQAKDPVLTRLAEAVSLEKNRWYYAAWAAYDDLRRNNKSNLAKLLETAFWARYDLLPLAEKAAK